MLKQDLGGPCSLLTNTHALFFFIGAALYCAQWNLQKTFIARKRDGLGVCPISGKMIVFFPKDERIDLQQR